MCKGAIFLFHYLISQTIGPCGICLVLWDSAILGSEGKKKKQNNFLWWKNQCPCLCHRSTMLQE